MYGPLLRRLGKSAQLVSVWGRSEESARKLGEQLDVPWYTDLDRLVRETRPEAGIVSVTAQANGSVALMALNHGLNVLIETPIAVDLEEADAIIEIATRKNLKVEVSEQFHLRPMEQIKLKLIESGLFGKVSTAFNDYAGHGYHGMSVLRSYIGFDERPLSVVGFTADYPLTPHYSQISGTNEARTETQEHGIIRFENGQTGIFHWTGVGYDSALRWWRSSRFMAENGMGISIGNSTESEERITLLSSDGAAPRPVGIQRVYERCDGGALVRVEAHTGDPRTPLVAWANPFATGLPGENPQWHDDEIGVASCIMSLVSAVELNEDPAYGARQARMDQALILALRRSAAAGGVPVPVT